MRFSHISNSQAVAKNVCILPEFSAIAQILCQKYKAVSHFLDFSSVSADLSVAKLNTSVPSRSPRQLLASEGAA
jgi:hypothetical protein